MRFDSVPARQHGCKLPFEQGISSGATAGPVTTYKLSPEELAKYGPRGKAADRERHWTQRIFNAVLNSASVEEAAAKMNWPVKRMLSEISLRAIKTPWEKEDTMKIEQWAEILPKERLFELKALGISERRIQGQYHMPINTFYALKKHYGMDAPQPVSDNAPESDAMGANCEVMDIVPSMNTCSENKPVLEPVWADNRSTGATEAIISVGPGGIKYNSLANRVVKERINEFIRVGVINGAVVIKPDDKGRFKVGRNGGGDKNPTGKTGGKWLGDFLAQHGVKAGRYVLAWNEARGWFESGGEVVGNGN